MTLELAPRYDSRASFYGKARVETDRENGQTVLTSYTTEVAHITSYGVAVVYGNYSQTTLRHIKEFLKQYGFKADSAKQIMADYGAK